MTEAVVCKYCGSSAVSKYGKVNGVQKYICKRCHRKFSADDKLYRMKSPASDVATALEEYYGGISIGNICKKLATDDGHQPSTKTVFSWINKYTDEAIERFRDYHPKVGDTWIADETVLRIDGANIWLYDIIDRDTRFMLASHVATSRTIEDAKKLMEDAARVAGKNPKVVITDRNTSYLDGIELAFGRDTEHHLGGPFKLEKSENTNLIERFHGTLKSRTKTMRGLKSVLSAVQFADGYLAWYNFMRPHEYLDNRTPAEAAGLSHPLNTWQAVILATEPQVEVLTVPAKVIRVSEQVPLVRPTLRRRYKAKRPRLRKRKPAPLAAIQLLRPRKAKP